MLKQLIAGAILLLTFTGAGLIAAELDGDAEALWRADIEEGNVAYSKQRLATLKIDDTIYLANGQSAYLERKEDSREHYAWTLTKPAAFVVSVAFDGKTAMIAPSGQSADQSKSVDLLTMKEAYSVSPTVDIRGAQTQLDRGESGIRVAVFNQNHPAAAEFKGFEYFAYDANAIVTARFEPEKVEKFVAKDFRTSRDWLKRFYLAGHAVFEREGKTVRLPMYTYSENPSEAKELSAFFMDALTGTETYGVGRYVDVEIKSFPVSELTIDFNYAYNPACAYSPHFNCPVAEARLPFAMRAGARTPSESPAH